MEEAMAGQSDSVAQLSQLLKAPVEHVNGSAIGSFLPLPVGRVPLAPRAAGSQSVVPALVRLADESFLPPSMRTPDQLLLGEGGDENVGTAFVASGDYYQDAEAAAKAAAVEGQLQHRDKPNKHDQSNGAHVGKATHHLVTTKSREDVKGATNTTQEVSHSGAPLEVLPPMDFGPGLVTAAPSVGSSDASDPGRVAKKGERVFV